MNRLSALALLLTGCVFTSDDTPPPDSSSTDQGGEVDWPSPVDLPPDLDVEPAPDLPDMPEEDTGVCGCQAPGPRAPQPPEDDPFCGCGFIGAEDSYCWSPDGCEYFLGGCPEGWAAICAT